MKPHAAVWWTLVTVVAAATIVAVADGAATTFAIAEYPAPNCTGRPTTEFITTEACLQTVGKRDDQPYIVARCVNFSHATMTFFLPSDKTCRQALLTLPFALDDCVNLGPTASSRATCSAGVVSSWAVLALAMLLLLN